MARTDLAFNGDLQVTATGDLDIISDLPNIKQAILRRILTIPGSLMHKPQYGCGILGFQNAPLTLAVQRQIAQKIAANLPRDPDVNKVVSVNVSTDDAAPGRLVVAVTADIVGHGTVTFKYTPFNGVKV
jgi:phage baseplate assembly protein W